jgi:hypothetical protein
MYLKKLLEEEHIDRAIERSLLFMDDWCSNNGCQLNQFFNEITTFEAVSVISMARVSPWVIFLTNSGNALLDRMSNEQLNMINVIIDQEIWSKKFINNKDDVKSIKTILKSANL